MTIPAETVPTGNQIVRTSVRLWSEEVAMARASDPDAAKKEGGYVFSNGRRFDPPANPYA